MCGVIGVLSQKQKNSMGLLSKKLLRMLEYRGYDSTGAIIQDEHNAIFFEKDVGSPTVFTAKYSIEKYSGKIFCGQVRWATFGAVDRSNAQPHLVKCKTYIYGAHNGNVTNCDQLKKWLEQEGHEVKSNNDGEMVVHAVEHFFYLNLSLGDQQNRSFRQNALKMAVVEAAKKLVGSYAAVIVDPISETMVAIKAGSSLYIGTGYHEDGEKYVLASSDLASVLSQTKILYPIVENEFALFDKDTLNCFKLKDGERVEKSAKRSKLTIEETELKDQYKYFMEQEIMSEADSARKLITLFNGGSDQVKHVVDYYKSDVKIKNLLDSVKTRVINISEIVDDKEVAKLTKELSSSLEFAKLGEIALKLALQPSNHQPSNHQHSQQYFESSNASFLEELCKLIPNLRKGLRVIDCILMHDESRDVEERIDIFADIVGRAHATGNTIYMLACGTSFHAAKSAAFFFDRVAGIAIHPVLPGEFRGQYENSIAENDVVIGISQSGETKDLIDIFNLLRTKSFKVNLISIVNNTNSSLPQEKSDLYVPLCCGPEIAVPATKSFMNQLIMLYILALKIKHLKEQLNPQSNTHAGLLNDHRHFDILNQIPKLIEDTISSTEKEILNTSEILFNQPSIHILGTGMYGIAREGALKIREVVLNHTEGFESSEFKHGPNTILGVNTVFGLESLTALLEKFCHALSDSELKGMPSESIYKLFKHISDYAFKDIVPGSEHLSENEMNFFKRIFERNNFFDSLYNNYPLIFVTGPSERETNLTISQINTHKIRGANIFIVAEENELLRDAIKLTDTSRFGDKYKSEYICLPKTGNEIHAFFSSTVVLQLLALKMSVKKMNLLDRLEIFDHGVNPDSPKNVSKSITVD
ncbi:MAG: SIS domain-containing protein [Oligoflexia bacterium]|nr:SIS domain-containing protein [Oligoflexia bacterium]